MERLAPLGIRTWLFVTPTLAIGLFALVVLLTLQNFRHQESVLSEIQTGDVDRLKAITSLSHRIARRHVELLAVLGDAGETVDEGQLYDQAKPKLDDMWTIESELEAHPDRYVSVDSDRALFDQMVKEFQEYRAEAVSAVLMTTVEVAHAQRYMAAANNAFQRISDRLATLTGLALERADGSMQQITDEARTLARNLVLILAGSAALSLTVAWLVSTILSRDISGVIRAMAGLARGETPGTIPGIARRDDIGRMARATRVFRETLERLRDEIAGHRRTEEALLAERNFVAAINDTVGALVIVLDRDGRIVRFNRACEELSGYRFEEVAGQLVWERLAHPHQAGAMEARIRSQLDGDAAPLAEATWMTRGGAAKRISFAITALRDRAGRVEYLIGCGTDVTDREAAEEKLRQAQKMEAIGQLTGGVAHDFNNLLAVMLGNLELIEERCHDDDEVTALTAPAMRAGRRGAGLTQRLLAFARRQPLSPRIVDIDGLVAGMVSMFRRTIGEEIEIQTRRTEGLWPCRVDPGQLEDAILNLALNARDAMPDGGRLTIRTANVRSSGSGAADERLDDGAAGDYVLLEISDDGIGIAGAIRNQIFEPFFTTKEIGKGSGLGLSMIYGFVKQSNGQISVDSEEGRGTTFRLYLPRASGTPETSTPPDRSSVDPEERSARILVVEDDADVRRLAVSLLASLGYDVVTAADGPAALDMLRELGRIDLLFSDVVLPGGMNGRRLADAARALQPGLKVLYMSGYAESALGAPPRHGTGDLLLHKPFRKSDLARAVRTALGPRTSCAGRSSLRRSRPGDRSWRPWRG